MPFVLKILFMIIGMFEWSCRFCVVKYCMTWLISEEQSVSHFSSWLLLSGEYVIGRQSLTADRFLLSALSPVILLLFLQRMYSKNCQPYCTTIVGCAENIEIDFDSPSTQHTSSSRKHITSSLAGDANSFCFSATSLIHCCFI